MADSDTIARRAMIEVLEDVSNGIVPYAIGSFAQLHEYVDANTYGGTEALLGELSDAAPPTDAGQHEALMKLCELAGPAFDKVDAWIRSGGILKGLPDEEPV